MKCKVAFDQFGNIISAGYVEGPVMEALGLPNPMFGPVAGIGQTIAELDVPEEYAKLPLTELIEKYHIVVQAEQPMLIAKK